ncbi:MAG: CDP-diacylglycerol--serine O-phosphatidyltransferase [Campylobacteraceae bacterium]
MSDNINDGKLKAGYILPNLFTAASAFLGIISIIAASKGYFDRAAIYIIISLICDGLDGRVARLTNTTSKFGVEFDSLADVIAFGVAPAMLFYFSFGNDFGRTGSLFAALYVVFGAIRLARFNVMSPTSEPSVFIGIPIPTAAVFVTMWTLIFHKYDFFNGYSFVLLIIMGISSILMVSNIRYPSFKKIDTEKPYKLKLLIFVTIVLSLVYLRPVETLTILVTLYVLYGILRVIYNYIAKLKKKKYN